MSNPLFNLMCGNPMQIMEQMANANPQQMLMNMLKQQNPQGYEQLQRLMNRPETDFKPANRQYDTATNTTVKGICQPIWH